MLCVAFLCFQIVLVAEPAGPNLLIIICIVTRGSRFFIVAYLTYKFGEKFGPFLEKQGAKWSIIITFILLLFVGIVYLLIK